jgi:hypothetical protein
MKVMKNNIVSNSLQTLIFKHKAEMISNLVRLYNLKKEKTIIWRDFSGFSSLDRKHHRMPLSHPGHEPMKPQADSSYKNHNSSQSTMFYE